MCRPLRAVMVGRRYAIIVPRVRGIRWIPSLFPTLPSLSSDPPCVSHFGSLLSSRATPGEGATRAGDDTPARPVVAIRCPAARDPVGPLPAYAHSEHCQHAREQVENSRSRSRFSVLDGTLTRVGHTLVEPREPREGWPRANVDTGVTLASSRRGSLPEKECEPPAGRAPRVALSPVSRGGNKKKVKVGGHAQRATRWYLCIARDAVSRGG